MHGLVDDKRIFHYKNYGTFIYFIFFFFVSRSFQWSYVTRQGMVFRKLKHSKPWDTLSSPTKPLRFYSRFGGGIIRGIIVLVFISKSIQNISRCPVLFKHRVYKTVCVLTPQYSYGNTHILRMIPLFQQIIEFKNEHNISKWAKPNLRASLRN